ncbi:MAG TPA: hypothetical protein VF647_18085 [Longimicrobium sp.]|jgi:hypothetical protein
MFERMPSAETEWLIQYTPPVSRSSLDRVQAILRTHQPFVPGPFLADPYDVVTYLPRQLIHREEYCLLVDRNIVTRWIGAVRGGKITPAHRAAAAVMAFAQCADLLIEPTIAFHEVVGRMSDAEIGQEIELFYTAEEILPTAWTKLALGQENSLPEPAPETRRERISHDLSMPLYRWRRSYVLALKIADLQLAGGKPEALMRLLIEWMYSDFLIGAAAVQLASHYFAPGAPRSGLLKALYSPDRQRAIEGVRNAAWDLTLIGEWLRRARQQLENPGENRRWILCTLDRSVRNMADGMLSYDESEDDLSDLIVLFSRVWRPEVAQRLATFLYKCQLDAANPSRYLNQDPKAEAIDALILEGEERVRSWTSSGHRS